MVHGKFKIFVLIFLLTGLTEVVTAQNFHGGVAAGLVGSQVAGDTYSGYNKAGIFAGGYVGWEFTKHSGIQLELEYFQKGSRKNPDPDKNDYSSLIFRLNYVELPVLYQYRIKWFIIEGGPSAGFLMGYYEEADQQIISDEEGYNKPARITLQINLGIRVFFSDHWGFDFRTNNSLLNIRTENRGGIKPGEGGDVWRLWGYGQFNDALVLSVFYQIK